MALLLLISFPITKTRPVKTNTAFAKNTDALSKRHEMNFENILFHKKTPILSSFQIHLSMIY